MGRSEHDDGSERQDEPVGSAEVRLDERLGEARALYLKGEYAAARGVDLQTAEAARGAGDTRVWLVARRFAAVCTYRLGQLDESQSELRAVIADAETIAPADSAFRFKCINHLANAVRSAGEIGDAIVMLEEALEKASAVDDQVAMCRFEGSLGAARDELGQKKRAVAHYERYLALAEGTGDAQRVAAGHDHLGRHDLAAGRFELARERFQRSLSYARTAGDTNLEATALMHLGNALVSEGRPQEALTDLDAAVALIRPTGNGKRLGEILLRRASAHVACDDYARALDDLTEAQELAKTDKIPRLEAKAEWARGEVWAKLDCRLHAFRSFITATRRFEQLLLASRGLPGPAYREAAEDVTAHLDALVVALTSQGWSPGDIQRLRSGLESLDAVPTVQDGERPLAGPIGALWDEEQRRVAAERRVFHLERQLEALRAEFEGLAGASDRLTENSGDSRAEAFLDAADPRLVGEVRVRWQTKLLPGLYDQLDRRSQTDVEVAGLLHIKLRTAYEIATLLLLRTVEREVRDRLLVPFRKSLPKHRRAIANRTDDARRSWWDGGEEDIPTLGSMEKLLLGAVGVIRASPEAPTARAQALAQFVGRSAMSKLLRVSHFLTVAVAGCDAVVQVRDVRNKLAHGDEQALEKKGHQITPEWVEDLELKLTIETPRMLRALLELSERLRRKS